MNRDLLLILVGACISLVTALCTIILQHILQLRADRVKRERDAEESLRKQLVKDVDKFNSNLFLRKLKIEKKIHEARIEVGEHRSRRMDTNFELNAEIRCKKCGFDNKSEAMYCGNCGEKINRDLEQKRLKAELGLKNLERIKRIKMIDNLERELQEINLKIRKAKDKKIEFFQ